MKKEEKYLKRGLSKQETRLLARLSASGRHFITIEDIKNSLECSHDNAKRIASDLSSKKWRVKRRRRIGYCRSEARHGFFVVLVCFF
jgi:predicted transcriptional regulator of viral defense system